MEKTILVQKKRFGFGVFLGEAVARHQLLLSTVGRLIPRRSPLSVQVDWEVHVEVSPPICFLNHSCEPNCFARLPQRTTVVAIHALQDLMPGVELLLDYEMFEYELGFFPLSCRCGCPTCRQKIRGYRHLSEDLKQRYHPYLADYLKSPMNLSNHNGKAND